jgi:hypothetical protein
MLQSHVMIKSCVLLRLLNITSALSVFFPQDGVQRCIAAWRRMLFWTHVRAMDADRAMSLGPAPPRQASQEFIAATGG